MPMYKNISKGIVPIIDKGQIAPGIEVFLTEEDIQRSDIAPYIGNMYLQKIPEGNEIAPAIEVIPVVKVQNIETTENNTGVIVNAPLEKPIEDEEEIEEVIEEASKSTIGRVDHQGTGVVVNPPIEQTEKQLKAEKKSRDKKLTVGIIKSEKTQDGTAITTIEEVSVQKIAETIKKIKKITVWQKRVQFIEEKIDDLFLLKAIALELDGKALDAVKQKIKKLSK